MTMATSLHLSLLRRCKPLYASAPPTFRFLSNPIKFQSTTATPFPLQYEMVISRPANSPHRQPSRRRSPATNSQPDAEMGFDQWVDKKLSTKQTDNSNTELPIDKSKRKYYNKRRKRMYGESDSDDENGRRRDESDFIELKQQVVELRTLHKREEELYFHDTFAYPWEKNKHYRMVYQLEKKYFPDQGFDKAFMETNDKQGKKGMRSEGSEGKGEDDKGVVFFEEIQKEGKDMKVEDVTEKKVEDFFKCLKKFPNENGGSVAAAAEPFLSTRSVGLPPKWDGPNGTVVLVNKPKGDIFYEIFE